MSKSKKAVTKHEGIKGRLSDYFRAGYAGIYLVSYEEQRVEGELAQVCADIGFDLHTWTLTDSLVGPIGSESPNQVKDLDPIQLLGHIKKMKSKTVVIAKDFHLFLGEAQPMIVRAVKDCLAHARAHNQVLVVLGCQYKLCAELEKEFAMCDFTLPDRVQLGKIAREIASGTGVEIPDEELESIMDAAAGLTTCEAADAFALSLIENDKKKLEASVVHREKSNAVKKNGLLEIVKTDLDWARIGGNANVKDWVSKRQKAFSKAAVEYRLPRPKGLLLIGVPGTGKTMIGKAIANVLNVPLLKLDGGKLFGGLVGQSESNTRAVIQTAEAIAPCVLFIDELEKALSGSKSSGQTDGGTAARVLGTLLQWLQDKTSPVFVVATANNVSELPPELLRKGRWDEMFFVDLPSAKERADIVSVVASKFGRKPEAFDAPAIAGVTEGFTGAEIEGAFSEAMFEAFSQDRELTTEDVLASCSDVVPITQTMGEQITALRNWCQGRARRASEPEVKTSGSGIRLIA